MLALVRGVSPAFARALAMAPPDEPIDVARAIEQHGAYVALLERLGVRVVAIPGSPDHPDSCFVEDTAVVAGGLALIARPGAPSRRGETPPVRDELAKVLPVADMHAPSTLDGGDCLLLGSRLYVGMTTRTNRAGVESARRLLAPRGIEVVAVPLDRGLHLKSVCSPLGGDTVLVTRGALPERTFGDARVVYVEPEESEASNAVCLGRDAIVASGHPRAADAIARAGLTPYPIDTGELRKADGALTCLSILVGP